MSVFVSSPVAIAMGSSTKTSCVLVVSWVCRHFSAIMFVFFFLRIFRVFFFQQQNVTQNDITDKDTNEVITGNPTTSNASGSVPQETDIENAPTAKSPYSSFNSLNPPTATTYFPTSNEDISIPLDSSSLHFAPSKVA
eukprot:209_1